MTMRVPVFVASLSLLATGCATTGSVAGDLSPADGNSDLDQQNAQVRLRWHSTPLTASMGSIWGSLPDGTSLAGSYVKIEAETKPDVLAPLWQDWPSHWPEWSLPCKPQIRKQRKKTLTPGQAFICGYHRHVVATLRSTDNSVKMRCRFSLHRPKGPRLGRGGNGECQLSTGQIVVGARLDVDKRHRKK